jgi:hypothetical protein
MVIEEHYVDRNFIEEVAAYYSRCFRQPPNSCARIHVFGERFSAATLRALQVAAAAGGRRALKRAEQLLTRAYLGFIVVRPLPSVPIGRTVLTPVPGVGRRSGDFSCTVPYPIFFLGLRLSVRGLAFQQQDLAVAACATTAIWSALQRVCRHEGTRPPTTSGITAAATRHSVPSGRAMPLPGLTAEQMWDALRHFEYAPDFFRAAPDPKLFLFQVNLYLRSGIPVILSLQSSDTEGHAIVAVGFSPSRRSRASQYELDGTMINLRNLEYDSIYVHDDSLGPYAEARLTIQAAPRGPGNTVYLEIESKDRSKTAKVEVMHGAAPLYSKIRTRGVEILHNASILQPYLSRAAGSDPAATGLEVFFFRSGDYLRSLYRFADPQRLSKFQLQISLSRYIGIARWTLFGSPAMDMIWDTTDTGRANHRDDHLLGLVALDRSAEGLVDTYARVVSVPSG